MYMYTVYRYCTYTCTCNFMIIKNTVNVIIKCYPSPHRSYNVYTYCTCTYDNQKYS